MGGYNHKAQIVPRLQAAAENLHAEGWEDEAEAVEEVIAVIEGRLRVKPDGTLTHEGLNGAS